MTRHRCGPTRDNGNDPAFGGSAIQGENGLLREPGPGDVRNQSKPVRTG
jgi:hypothetical protein